MKMSVRATILAASMLAPPAVIEAAERTVFVTVVDGNGAAVTDLTAADLVVKEGGKQREIVKAGPASAKMRLTIAVEERLIADTAVRHSMFAFMKRVIDRAEIRLVTIGLRNNTAADYTGALDVLVAGITSSRSIHGPSLRSPKASTKWRASSSCRSPDGRHSSCWRSRAGRQGWIHEASWRRCARAASP